MAKKDDSQPDDSKRGRMAVVGLEIAAGAGLGAAIGTWIDRKWHSDPWGVLIGTFLGIAAGMYLLIKEAINTNKN
jgi:F0F1-type ATP synthase assembly protein I